MIVDCSKGEKSTGDCEWAAGLKGRYGGERLRWTEAAVGEGGKPAECPDGPTTVWVWGE